MVIEIAQQNYKVGDIKGNALKIISAIENARSNKVDVVLFSELALCAYPPHDDIFRQGYFENLQTHISKICKACKNITAVIGTPRKNKNKIFNSAIVISNQKIIHVYDKFLLPEYDVFNERRFFCQPEKINNIVVIKNKKIALSICEDIWFNEKLYPINPLQNILKEKNVEAIFNLSASPFDYLHLTERTNVLCVAAIKYKVPIFYANSVGAHTDLIFDGNSFIINKKGKIVLKAQSFEEDNLVVDTKKTNDLSPMVLPKTIPSPNILAFITQPLYIKNIYEALILGIRDYCKKTNFNKVILGASGGIDSAVVQVLASQALGAKNVFAVLMPSQFSSKHSVLDAQKLSKNLSNSFKIISIQNEYETFLTSLTPVFKNLPFSIAEENLQSRIRGNVLMTIANKFNYLLLNTSNKSELAMGYGTLYGDMAGGISVLGDLFKTQVYALANYINQEKEIIPKNILIKAPSAELKPNQKDSDSLPTYDILDTLLFQIIHKNLALENIIAKNIFPQQVVTKTFRQYGLNEYKRFQFCPILRVSSKSFGRGRKIEVVAHSFDTK